MTARTSPLMQARLAAASSSCNANGCVSQRDLQTKIRSVWLILLLCTAISVVRWQAQQLAVWQSQSAGAQYLQDSLEAEDVEDAHTTPPGLQQLAYPVWWHAPFYTGTGYSTEAISYVVSLLQSKRFRREDVWVSHSGDQIKEQVVHSLEPETLLLLQEQEYNSLIRGPLQKQDLERPAIAVCHTFPDCWLLPKDTNGMDVPGCPCPAAEAKDLIVYRVGRTMFETNSLPKHLVDHCNAMDEVWVPTEFNRATFAAAGVSSEKLFVVPQGIDAAQFDPEKYDPLVLKDLPNVQLVTGSEDASTNTIVRKPFVFMSVFKWETRKGWDVLLEAYLHEFKAAEPVELHIMTKPFGKGKANFREQVLQWLQRKFAIDPSQAASLPRVFVHTEHTDDATYPRLYKSCDAVVLPTRGEGWGRPQMEAMSMAKPVITTNWSGPTAYINDRVAYPLAVDHLTAADADMNVTVTDEKDINPYFKGQYWAQPNVSHLKQLMRQVFRNPKQAAAKGRQARAHILRHFTPDVLADVVMSEILRIQDKLGLDRTVPPPEARQEAASAKALCMAYQDLCKQGPAGVAEAARRAQSSFSQFRTHRSTELALHPNKMTVAELIAVSKQSEQHRHKRRVAGVQLQHQAVS